MQITSKSAAYAVVRTAYHSGGVESVHKSLTAAERAAKAYRRSGCECGCCAVIPITAQARQAMPDHGRDACGFPIPLLSEIPAYTGNEFSPYSLRR